MQSHSELLQYYHNKGEQDYAAGNGCHPPYGGRVGLAFATDKELELFNAYLQGYKNAQKKKINQG